MFVSRKSHTRTLSRLLQTSFWLLLSAFVAPVSALDEELSQDATAEIKEPGPIATTPQGKYEGLSIEGVNAFLGIPYAASTSGENRWKEPAPLPAHEDVLPANAIGPACPQARATHETSEDCLNLNIWTPELQGAKKPVMVWIHGGGLRAGSNNVAGELMADPSRYNKPVVLVAINYRLGPLGFFSHRSLKGKHANFGLLDMVAALEWVQSNIASFGGDPNNVTIFGVSAGGMAVNMLMTSPLSEGLFHKAIAQSGYGTWPLTQTRHSRQLSALDLDGAYLRRAERQGADLVKHLIKGKQTRKALYELTDQQLIDALHGFQLPYVDGQSLKAEPGIRFVQNKQHKVPYITGGVSNEGSVMGGVGITTEDFAKGFGRDKKKVRKLYERDFFRDDNAGWNRVFGDTRYLLSARVLGEAMAEQREDTWLYYIDFIPESFKTKWLGTPHGMDGWLLFNGLASAETDIQAFTRNLHSYWLNFAHTGNPNGNTANTRNRDGEETEVQPLPAWPAYSADTRQWLVMSSDSKAKENVIGSKLDLLVRRYDLRISPALNLR